MELNWDSLISIHQNFSVLQSTLQNFWLTHELKINPIYSKMADINDWEPFHLRWFDFLVVDILLHKKMEKAPGQGSGDLSFTRHSVWGASIFLSVNAPPVLRCYYEDFIFIKLYIISPELHRNFIFHPFCSHTHKKLSCSPELSCSAPFFSFTLRPNYC